MTGAGRLGAVALLLAAAGVARADGFATSGYRSERLVSLGWEVARPRKELEDFAGGASPRGAQFELRFGVARQLSLGLAASWSWLSQNLAAGEMAYPDALVTGPKYQRVQLYTLRATTHWLLTRGAVQPYLGVGLGGVRYDAREEIGGLARRSRGFGLAAGPEAGLLVALRPGVALHLQCRWQWTGARFAGVQDASWLTATAGVAIY